jgi:hypothetical protein
VMALEMYRRVYDPFARLSIVGRAMSPGYSGALGSLVSALGLCGAV